MTQHRRIPTAQALRPQRGFSLIELMVSIVIGLAMIVAMGVISTKFETSKRENASSTDLSSNAAFLSYELDRQVRSAGSGFTINAATTFGCQLTASKDNAQILPFPAALAAPFDSVPLSPRLLPVLVYPGIGANGSDVLQVMTGTGGVGEVSYQVGLKSFATNTMRLASTVGLQANDLVLIAQADTDCMVEQVSSTFTGATTQVDLAGSYYASVINGQALNDRSIANNAMALVLGNAANFNYPRFQLLGVSTDNQLMRFDMLRATNGGTSNNQAVALADGVVDMRVRYGVDTTTVMNGTVDSWVLPTTASSYNVNTLNVANAQPIAARVLALKIALVLRSENFEKDVVAPPTLTMFTGLDSSLQATYSVAAADRKRRHTVVEVTIPIRNALANSGRATPP